MRVSVAALFLAGFAGHALAIPTVPVQPVIQELQRRGIVPVQPQRKPTEATGFPGGGQKDVLPAPRTDSTKFVLKNADSSRREGSRVVADGDVRFSFRGYECRADSVDGDVDTQIFVLSGNVVITGSDQAVKGVRAVVNFDARTIAYDDAKAILGPAFVGPSIRSNLYLKGSAGGGSRKHFHIGASTVTSCEREHPHYEFQVRDGDIQPGKRAVLRDVRIRLFDRTLLRLPYVLIPLEERVERYTPEVGQSRDEGYFIKNRLGFPVGSGDSMFARTDYFSKLGAGLGLDYDYAGAGKLGRARVYGLPGRTRTGLVSLEHRQAMLGGLVRIDSTLIQNNYLTAPNNRTYNARGTYTINTPGGRVNFSATRTGNRTSGFGSINQVFSLSHDESWNGKFRTSFSSDLTQNRSAAGGQKSDRRVANLSFRGTQDFDRAQAQLDYQRQIPVGQQNGFFGSTDRTPLVTLSTDSRKLWGTKGDKVLPLRGELSLGELADSVQRKRFTRTALDLSSQKSVNLPRDGSANYALRFRQGVYSNNTAQYVLNSDLGYKLGIRRKTSIFIRHSYLNPFGFTPIASDRTGRNHQVSADLQYEVAPTFNVSAQTSYDFLQLDRKQVAWQNVGVRTDWTPNDKLFIRTLSNYDPFNQWWSNVRLDAGWKVSKGYVSAGLRYDGPRHRWGSVNVLADGLEWKRLRTSVLANFNGYSNKIESWQLSMTYDLHCAEAVLQIIENKVGFRSGREIGFFIRLKALPFDTPFGIGRRGQGLGTGTGIGF